MSAETKTAKAPLTKEEKRNRIILAILSGIIVVLILGGFIFGSPYSIKRNTYSSFEKMVTENYDKPTVIFCTKPSCPYCDKVAPQISQVKDKYKDQVNFYYIDVLDDGEGSELWSRFKPGGIDAGKTGVPCTIYLYARRDVNDPIEKKTAIWAYGGKYEKNTYNDILKRVEDLLENPYGDD